MELQGSLFGCVRDLMELVLFLNALRSGLLTFFSSLVIQESLINFAGERLRSKTDSHCESVFYFCLSASYPGVEFVFAEIASTSQPIRTSFFTMLALVWSSGRFLTAKTHILFSRARNRRNGVRFPKHPQNVSRSFRCSGTTFHF